MGKVQSWVARGGTAPQELVAPAGPQLTPACPLACLAPWPHVQHGADVGRLQWQGGGGGAAAPGAPGTVEWYWEQFSVHSQTVEISTGTSAGHAVHGC